MQGRCVVLGVSECPLIHETLCITPAAGRPLSLRLQVDCVEDLQKAARTHLYELRGRGQSARDFDNNVNKQCTSMSELQLDGRLDSPMRYANLIEAATAMNATA